MKIAVFGATGATGASAVAALRRERGPYRVVGRSLPALRAAFGDDPEAELATWQPGDRDSVSRAADGADAILILIGGDFHRWELLPDATRTIVAGAIAAGVRRVVLAGTVLVYGVPRARPVGPDHPLDARTRKGLVRIEQERILREASDKIEFTILRLPDFYGPGVEKSILAPMFRTALTGARAPLFAPFLTPHEFVFVPDLGPIMVALAEEPRAANRVFNLGGPGVITQRAMAELAFAATGQNLRVLPVGPTLLRIGGLFDPRLRELVELRYLHTTPLLVDDSSLREVIHVPKTSYLEGVNQTIAWLRKTAEPVLRAS
jgi:nucleoside-diphosphate-sugar epimerase